MQVHIHDPVRSARVLWQHVLGCFLGATLLASMVPGMFGWPALFVGLSLGQFASLFRVRGKPREAELSLGPGFVQITSGKGLRKHKDRIVTRDLVGASTAERDGAVVLALTRSSRKHSTTTLTVKTDAEAAAIRDALGIGHDGFGTVRWSTDNPRTRGMAILCGVVSALCFALAAVGFRLMVQGSLDQPLHDEFRVLLLLYGVVPGLMMSGFAAFYRWNDVQSAPCVVLAQHGMWVYRAGWSFVPYAGISGASLTARGISFHLLDQHGRVYSVNEATPALSQEERTALIEQVQTASKRARGLGMPRTDAAQRVEVVRRGGSTNREWFARLDAIAMSLGGTGYRAVGLQREDLSAVVADPDADAELRVAAARVLCRVDAGNKERVVALAEATRDEATQLRIRIAVEDDDAGLHLDTAEQRNNDAVLRRAVARAR